MTKSDKMNQGFETPRSKRTAREALHQDPPSLIRKPQFRPSRVPTSVHRKMMGNAFFSSLWEDSSPCTPVSDKPMGTPSTPTRNGVLKPREPSPSPSPETEERFSGIRQRLNFD